MKKRQPKGCLFSFVYLLKKNSKIHRILVSVLLLEYCSLLRKYSSTPAGVLDYPLGSIFRATVLLTHNIKGALTSPAMASMR